MSKKNSLFIFILICLFMFVGIDRVEAATGMYCVYKKGVTNHFNMLVQDNYGDFNVYYIEKDLDIMLSNDNINYDSFLWKNAVDVYGNNFIFDIDDEQKDSNGDLISCPKYFREQNLTFSNDKDGIKISELDFLDEFDYELLEEKSKIFNDSSIKSNNISFAFLTSDVIIDEKSYTSQNYKEQWLSDPIYEQSCLYAYQLGSKLMSIQLDIDFTNKKVRVSAVDFLENGYDNVFDEPVFTVATNFVTDYNVSYIERYYKNSCPFELMGYVSNGSETLGDANDKILYFSYNMKAFKGDDTPFEPYRYNLVKSQPQVGDISITIDKNIVDVENCEDLLGSELTEILHTAVNVVKILVPILLIVLGIVDFSQAVFGSKEDDMKKASSKFIKRVIIGVVIFFIPSILNLLLLIASSIWGNIDPTLCGIL